MHNLACFMQTCDQTELRCGRAKFEELFGQLRSKLGDSPTLVVQHQKQSYTKPDGSQVTLFVIQFLFGNETEISGN